MSAETVLMWAAAAVVTLAAIGLAVVIVLFAAHNMPFGPVQWHKRRADQIATSSRHLHDVVDRTAAALGNPNATLMRDEPLVALAEERMRELDRCCDQLARVFDLHDGRTCPDREWDQDAGEMTCATHRAITEEVDG